jgi:hypothetical protein
MGVWHRVAKLAMDYLKFHPGPPCLTLLYPSAVTGVARSEGGRPASVFTLLDTPRRSPMFRSMKTHLLHFLIFLSSRFSADG